MKAQYWYRNNNKNRHSIFHGHTSQNKILKSDYAVLQTKKEIPKGLDWIQNSKEKREHERMKYYTSGTQRL